MMHWRARRLLVSLPDGTLDPRTEAAVRAHVEECVRCQRELGALELAEALVRRLPASLLPLEADLQAQSRLAALARWSEELEVMPSAERWPVPVLGIASVVAVAVLTVTVGHWSPIVGGSQGGNPVTVASVVPDTSYVPRTVR